SALKGNYSISVARTLQVLVDFKLSTAVVPPPPPPPPLGPGMNLIVDNFDIRGLSDPQLSDLRQRVNALVGKPLDLAQVQEAIRQAAPNGVFSVRPDKVSDNRATVVLGFGSESKFEPEFVKTPFGVIPRPGQRGGAVEGTPIQTPFGPVANNGAPD